MSFDFCDLSLFLQQALFQLQQQQKKKKNRKVSEKKTPTDKVKFLKLLSTDTQSNRHQQDKNEPKWYENAQNGSPVDLWNK